MQRISSLCHMLIFSSSIVPIISFWIGIFISWHLYYSYFNEKQLLWKRGTLITEIFILFITGLIPSSYIHIIANTLVSFAASLQFCAFRKLGTTEVYASVFCTGNMRSCAENYYKGLIQKDKQCLKKSLVIVLSSFHFSPEQYLALQNQIFYMKRQYYFQQY